MPTALAPSVTHRDKKGRKFISIVGAAYDKAGLSEEEAQCVNDAPGLPDAIRCFIAEHRRPNQFADEEVPSHYGYFSGYSTPKGITEQCMVLRQHFPGIPLRVDEDVEGLPLPEGAEGWFAIPRWERIASTYGEALQKVLELIKQTRNGKFHNYREDQLGEPYLRQHERTAAYLKRLGEAQRDHDILVVPAQFGLRHRGSSVRRGRVLFAIPEFGLGAFQSGCMLLTHPERLAHHDDLWMDCAGDEFAPDAGGDFCGAPCFYFGVGAVGFGTRHVGGANGVYGSASAFLPQQ
ncbi:MAG: hypothetical protein AAB671_02220 [Patescibacteria group bacterium]